MERIVLHNKTLEQIVYYKTGAGQPLLLVHGFPANVGLWRFVLPELARHYTVLLPDFFESEAYWLKNKSISMELLAAAFNDILVAEGIERIVLAGHSMGGYMGLCFAAKFSGKIAGLCLVHSSPLGDDPARAEGRRKTVNILKNGGKSPFLRKMVPALFPEAFRRAQPEIVDRQLVEALNVNDESLVAFYEAIMNRNETTAVVHEANFPVQYIVGKQDSLANITKELAEGNLADVNFVSVYEAGGHMVMLEDPERLTADLLRFLRFCWK